MKCPSWNIYLNHYPYIMDIKCTFCLQQHDGWPLHIKWEVCHANPPILHYYLFGHYKLAYSIFKHFNIGPIL
ncbi:hypothetical protein F383_38089 [Gossypium arboreum]|uniref:Uncharacterized protein n=1 Tax=Gossypium arboreum TaxID=29729 RepID=A0A0B0NC38_GOSAR|nr:hypothetical protein F383_38089 [Gossypium arboreum]